MDRHQFSCAIGELEADKSCGRGAGERAYRGPQRARTNVDRARAWRGRRRSIEYEQRERPAGPFDRELGTNGKKVHEMFDTQAIDEWSEGPFNLHSRDTFPERRIQIEGAADEWPHSRRRMRASRMQPAH